MTKRLFDAARITLMLTGLALTALSAGTAHAVPSYARQTGAECAACHVGAYGPNLTPYGIRFKLGGYTETGGKNGKDSVPLSASLRLDYNLSSTGSNDTRLSAADIYLAGRLTDNVGSFISVQRDDNGSGNVSTSLRNLDVRYVRDTKVGGKDALLGITLNNNPGIQDPIDANQASGFPAISTEGTLFNPTVSGQLPRRVVGLTAYGYVDNAWYGELGGYRSMSRGLQDKLGLNATANDPGAMDGISPYWRLAYIRDFKTQLFSVGIYGMNADKHLTVLSQPGAPRVTDRSGPADSVRDIGLNAMYQYRGDRSNVVNLRANYVDEHRSYGSTPVVFGQIAGATGKVREATFLGTYSFNETWSASAGRVWVRTNQDSVRYLNGSGDSDINYYELAWVPFGKENSWGSPWANLRLLASWIRFDKFNGASNDLFGARFGGPLVNARDLNAVQLSAMLAF